MVNIAELRYFPPAFTVEEVYKSSETKIQNFLDKLGLRVVAFRLPVNGETILATNSVEILTFRGVAVSPRLILEKKPAPREFLFVEIDDYREATCYDIQIYCKVCTFVSHDFGCGGDVSGPRPCPKH